MTERTFTPGGQVKKQTVKHGNETLYTEENSYRLDGNLIRRTVTTGGKTTADTYAYDGAGMLLREMRTQDGVQKYDYQYEYDNRGNRTRIEDRTAYENTGYTYDLNNRLTNTLKYTYNPNTVVENTDYYYDSNGNLISSLMSTIDYREVYSDDYFNITTDYGNSSQGYAFTQYEYDVYNRLTSFKNGEHEATYTYNPGNLRRTKTVDGKTTQYVWDGSEIAAEIDKDYDVIRNKYIYGLDRVLCEGPYSVNTYYQQNSHGDTITITDGNADTLVMYEYDAFGNQLNPDTEDTNPFRYCGQYLDNETGSYYLRARYYQPTYGRFLTADSHWNMDNMIYGDNPVKINERENPYNVNAPMSFAYLPDITAVLQSGNLYVYCMNEPIIYADRDGEIGILLTILIGAGVGALVNGGFTIFKNVKNGESWSKGIGKALLSGGVSGAISVMPIPGINQWVSVAVTGATGNLVGQLIAGEINSAQDVSSALSAGAAAGIIGKGAADLINKGFQEYFKKLTKAQQKKLLNNIGKITNKELSVIRKEISQGITNSKLNELVTKYGYDVIVSAFVSSTVATGVQ